MNPAGKHVRLGEILMASGIIDRLQLNTALKYQKEWDRKLGEALVELGFISEGVLVKVLSKFLQVPTVELSQVRIHPMAVQKVPRRLAEKFGLIPLDLEGEGPSAILLVAMIDPTNVVAIDEVAFTAGCRVKAVVATHSEISQAIRRHYGHDRVVELFFDAREQDGQVRIDKDSNVNAQENTERISIPYEAKSGEEEELVIERGWGNTITPKPEPAPPSDTHALLQAVVRLLIRKGIFQAHELQQEYLQGRKERKGD